MDTHIQDICINGHALRTDERTTDDIINTKVVYLHKLGIDIFNVTIGLDIHIEIYNIIYVLYIIYIYYIKCKELNASDYHFRD